MSIFGHLEPEDLFEAKRKSLLLFGWYQRLRGIERTQFWSLGLRAPQGNRECHVAFNAVMVFFCSGGHPVGMSQLTGAMFLDS